MTKKIYVIAGEASGDLHGANLIKALQKETPPLQIYGVGGDRIRETGAHGFYDLAHFHVTGLTDALKRLPEYRRAAAVILESVKRTHPDLVILIDNPGLNLHLAERIHGLGIPIVYYIAPQVWAWAPKRVEKIKRTVKKVLVVFEFEKKIYEDSHIPVAWVGHPLKDLITASGDPEGTRRNLGLERGERLVSLLPGSRKGELKTLFSVFTSAAVLLSKRLPGLAFALIKSPTLPTSFYDRLLKKANVPIRLIEDNSYAVLEASDAAIVCSGTATLECALLETPMIIANKSSFLTYLAAKKLIKVPYLGLPNLVLGQKSIPELLQYDATPENLAEEAMRILTDESARSAMIRDLKEVSRRLGEEGASRRAAREILKLLDEMSQ